MPEKDDSKSLRGCKNLQFPRISKRFQDSWFLAYLEFFQALLIINLEDSSIEIFSPHRYSNVALFESSRSSLAAPDYDVPRPRLPVSSSLPSRHNTPVPKTPTPPPPTQQIYDVPVSKELPLELDSALEGLQRLQSEASAAIARLLGFVSPGWRTPQRLDATLMDLRLAALRLRTSLHDLAEFAEGLENYFSFRLFNLWKSLRLI